MKVKELIKKLQQVDGDRTVYTEGENGNNYDFSGISFDDLNDVSLYITQGDKEA